MYMGDFLTPQLSSLCGHNTTPTTAMAESALTQVQTQLKHLKELEAVLLLQEKEKDARQRLEDCERTQAVVLYQTVVRDAQNQPVVVRPSTTYLSTQPYDDVYWKSYTKAMEECLLIRKERYDDNCSQVEVRRLLLSEIEAIELAKQNRIL
jgi:hypothetical protein